MSNLLADITPWISDYGLYIVFIGMITEGTTMIILSGVLCYLGLLPLYQTILVAILGAIVGDQMWYFIGRYYASYILKKFPSMQKRVDKILPLIDKKGKLFAFGSRFIYSGAIIFPLSLGIDNFSYKKFTLFDAIGVSLWSIVGISIGYILGNSTESIIGEIKKVEELIFLILFIIFIVYLYRNFYKKRGF